MNPSISSNSRVPAWISNNTPAVPILEHQATRRASSKDERRISTTKPRTELWNYFSSDKPRKKSIWLFPLDRPFGIIDSGPDGNVLIYRELANVEPGQLMQGMGKGRRPTLIKKIKVTDLLHQERLKAEIELSRSFKGKPGLLSLRNAWDDHRVQIFGDVKPCYKGDCYTYLSFEGFPLGTFAYLDILKEDPEMVRVMLRQTLEGLKELHDRDIIHRGVKRQNLLVMARQPPQAVLADMSSVKIDAKYTHSYNNSPHCKPPELNPALTEFKPDQGTDKAGDIWSWGVAIAKCLSYEFKRPGEPISASEALALSGVVYALGRSNPAYSRIAYAAAACLQFYPSLRPDVNTLLTDYLKEEAPSLDRGALPCLG